MADNFKTIQCDGCQKVVGELAEGKGRYVCKNCKGITVVEVKKGIVKVLEFLPPANKVERIRLLGEVSDPYQERLGMHRKD